MDRILKVTGKAKAFVKPDMARVLFNQTEVSKSHDEALKESAKIKAALVKALSKAGFKEDALKTLSFSVQTEYEGYEENGIWKQRLAGFRYSHRLKLEFEKEKLKDVLAAVLKLKNGPEFSIEYYVKDPEAVKEELLKDAAEDCRKKALLLAEGAGVKLGAVSLIDYSFKDEGFAVRPVNGVFLREAAKTASFDMNIEADDIEIEDSVTISWAIE